MKEKVESLLDAEESLGNANEVIQDLSQKYESVSEDREKMENHYQKDFETIVNTLSSLKVYERDTIDSSSLMEVIQRSLNEIKHENRESKAKIERLKRLLDESKSMAYLFQHNLTKFYSL